MLWLVCPLALAAGPDAFRFAFLTYTHVGSGTGAEDLRATVRDLNTLTGLSFVVISGDITEYGSREQLQLAKEILDGLKVPYHLIPGNHDTKWSESGAADFPPLWKEDRFVFDQGPFRFFGIHEGPIMKMGDGHWSPQDVRWLDRTLTKLRSKDQPVVFVTHYPIDDSIANWYLVLDLLKKYNTQVVLCGHGHANRQLLFESVPGVMGRSNLRAAKLAGGYNLVEVKDGRMSFCERITGQETKPAWCSVTLQQHKYASDTNHYPRPDFSINERFPGVTERWSFKTGFTIASAPMLWNGIGIVGDASGTAYAFDLQSGKVRWRFKAQGAVYSTPDVGGPGGPGRRGPEVVAFACCDGSVYTLNATNGSRVWRFKTGRPIVASPTVDGERVYIGSSEGKFRALDLAHGKPAWEFDGLGGFVGTKPLLYDGKVIFGAWDGHLFALDAETWKLEWKWQGNQLGTLLSPAACWPVAANGSVFIVAPDRKMTALKAATGEQIWRTGQFVVRESIGLSGDQDRFYVRSMNDFFYAFSTAASAPQELWELNAHFGYDINSGMLVEKDGTVFYGTKNGLLFALDSRSGSIQWQYKFGVGVMNTVAPLSANAALATDSDGKVAVVASR
ncbi:MAG TPA: PQQ-binding-like beta-propeller repeat protein [Candidatus Acidoferrum sp.]|nr:PQQ-binding-like beta-propeller repeat protein [Candidatus Acidoferrum sp.]